MKTITLTEANYHFLVTFLNGRLAPGTWLAKGEEPKIRDLLRRMDAPQQKEVTSDQ